MSPIDERGNLFGLVNVVDAAVVILAVALVVASLAFLLQPEPEPEPTEPDLVATSATLDLGTQPSYLVEEIEVGDSYSPAENSELTISEIYVTPQDEAVRVILDVNLSGPESGGVLDYAGAPPRVGRSLDIQTIAYQVSGEIRGVDDPSQPTTTKVLVADRVSTGTAESIQAGDKYILGGRTVATVESITTSATNDTGHSHILVGLSLSTWLDNGTAHFGGRVIRRNASVLFRTDEYEFTGQVRRVGTTEPRRNIEHGRSRSDFETSLCLSQARFDWE
ncbi:DUF4330 family protein [Halobium salinum]|uniref:DUF4330 family protein n=1 Tax=Halobium salinum TaxID=1364940 RepID=A0ABD5P9Y5_9EURY|nr:DUF4330 family protein [Halobium salinum]